MATIGDCLAMGAIPSHSVDTQILTMGVDERHHHFSRRSSSAIAKYDACAGSRWRAAVP
jgi:hypothetical protein